MDGNDTEEKREYASLNRAGFPRWIARSRIVDRRPDRTNARRGCARSKLGHFELSPQFVDRPLDGLEFRARWRLAGVMQEELLRIDLLVKDPLARNQLQVQADLIGFVV
jgi:hypothetical protein